MKNIKLYPIDTLIITLLYFYLIIDTFNGVIIRDFSFSLSSVYKFLILLLMMISLLKNKIFIPLSIIGILFIFVLLHLIADISSFLAISWILKFIMIVTAFYYFKLLIQINKFYIIKRLFQISFTIVSFNLLAGALGYGYAQYARNDIGTRGFFYAGNEVGVLLITTSIFTLSYLVINKDIKNFIAMSLSVLILAVLLTSKVALLGSGLLIFILPIINIFVTKKGYTINKASFKIATISSIIFLLLTPYSIYYAIYEMNLIARISYWIQRVDYVTLLYSGRNLLANDIFEFLKIDFNYFNILFGYGYDMTLKVVGKSVELNIVDLLMLYGLLGTLLVYGFFIYIFFININKNSKIFLFKPYVQFGILFLLLISVSSGHVLNSGLSGIMIGALMSLNYYSDNKVLQN